MSARGFTLIELLVATMVLMAVSGAIAAMFVPARSAFDRGMASAETTIRARVGIEVVVDALRQSGSSALIGSPTLNLPQAGVALLPRHSLDADAATGPFHAVTVLRVASGAGQALLGAPASPGSIVVRMDTTSPCPRQAGRCGFVDGNIAVLYGAARSEIVTIAGVDPATASLLLSSRLANGFPAGAVIAAIERDTYGLRPVAAGLSRLVRITTGRAEQTLVDGVRDFEISFDSSNWLQARQVDIYLRVDGFPDIDLRASVALRNR